MNYAWIVVADAARARIFSTSGSKSPLEPVEQLVSPASRLKERDLVSDRPGRSFDSKGKGRHSMERQSSASEQIARNFAGQVADHLEAGRTSGQYRRLILVAEPRFLGLLNKKITSETEKLITTKIDKNLSRQSDQEIRTHLPERI